MLKQIRRVNNWPEIREYLLEHKDSYAQPEKAYCAVGREQFWLQWEPNYQRKTYTPGISDERLWRFIKKIIPNADLAQIFYGNRGIDWHRDASYANKTAWLLALGSSTFEIQSENGGITSVDLLGGELLEFNCKLPHRAINVMIDRIGIGIWTAKIPLPITNA